MNSKFIAIFMLTLLTIGQSFSQSSSYRSYNDYNNGNRESQGLTNMVLANYCVSNISEIRSLSENMINLICNDLLNDLNPTEELIDAYKDCLEIQMNMRQYQNTARNNCNSFRN